MQIGRKIYFDLGTGNVILDTGEKQGSVIPTSVEQDIEAFSVLSERNRDTFDVIELEYGQYAQDFAESNGYRVNLEIKELEFSYPDPNEPEAPPVYRKPLTEENETLKIALAELAEMQEQQKLETHLALVELAELLLGGIE